MPIPDLQPPLADTVGDPLPPKCEIIEIHVENLRQIFNSIDPSPFRERDLDPNAADFIIGWARDLPHDAPLALLVHLDRPTSLADAHLTLRSAIHEFFSQLGASARRRLRQLFRIGRRSLIIGFACLAASIGMGSLIAKALAQREVGAIFQESLLIGGWVAMWRPLEIFLYDWWPIRAEARLYDRLSAMHVRLSCPKDPLPSATDPQI